MDKVNLSDMLSRDTLALLRSSPAFRGAVEQLAAAFEAHKNEIQSGAGHNSLDMTNLVQPQKQKLVLNQEGTIALEEVSNAIQSNKLGSITEHNNATLVAILTSLDSGFDESERKAMMNQTYGQVAMGRSHYAGMARIPGSSTFAYSMVTDISCTDCPELWKKFIAAIKERIQSS